MAATPSSRSAAGSTCSTGSPSAGRSSPARSPRATSSTWSRSSGAGASAESSRSSWRSATLLPPGTMPRPEPSSMPVRWPSAPARRSSWRPQADMTRGQRQRPAAPVGGRRLPFDAAPALSLAGLVVVALVSFALLGGSLPNLPGGNGGPNGPIRTPTPSNVVVIDPRADVPGSLLYVKGGNIWIQTGDQARQLTDGGRDSMPTWSPDGASIYFVRITREQGRWPSGAEIHEYNLRVPRLLRIA